MDENVKLATVFGKPEDLLTHTDKHLIEEISNEFSTDVNSSKTGPSS